ncbi:hypothetical protein [Celeribacter naphthalenivorans]|uniref:hypothetical protein n=1 Tax=Celeribacter naphthalenivorans TaxID=1614694 RepID=UPI001CFBD2F8|nr:hypothetical protein [Celeribacter naphthalenivorans]
MTKYDREQRPEYQATWAETFKTIGFASLFAGSGAAFSGIMGNFFGLDPWDVVIGVLLAIVLGLLFLALYFMKAARIDALIYSREHQPRYWDVQEFKISEDVSPNSPIWVSGGFASRNWDDANSLMNFLSKNNPTAIFRVAPTPLAVLVDRKENRSDELSYEYEKR